MKKAILFLILAVVTLSACENQNEEQLKKALKDAGVVMTSQDSVIAQRSYKCNYLLSYRLDTIYLETVGGSQRRVLIYTKAYYNRGIYVAKDISYKKMTQYQMDSVLVALYNKEDFKSVTTTMTANFLTSDSTNAVSTKTLNRTIYLTQVDLRKDYKNLY
jgi:uncharacterized lipoprotein NlpE involved in copper resistance